MNIVSFWELLNDNSTPPTPIIDNGILLDKTMLMIIGEPKSRKSFLAFNIATALSSGESFACFTIKEKRKVLILSAEGGYYPTRDRVKTMVKDMNEDTLSNVLYANKLTYDLNDEESFKSLKELIQEKGPEVVIIDPFIRFISEDENSSVKISQVFDRLRSLIDEFNISLIIIDHTGKDSRKGARGSSVKRSEYDSAIYMSRQNHNISLRFDMRHVETPDNQYIKFNPDTFWFEIADSVNSDYRVLELVRGNPGLEKSDLAKALAQVYECSQATAYRQIDKSVDSGYVHLIEGKYHLAENLN